MIRPMHTAESWAERIQQLHGEIVSNWVDGRIAGRPAVLDTARMFAVLKPDESCEPLPAQEAELERANVLARMREQLAWAVRKIDQFRELSDTDRLSIDRFAELWLAEVQGDWLTQSGANVRVKLQNATRTYLQNLESVCLQDQGSNPISEEYSPELQLRTLHLTPAEMGAPILDIGCGKDANLVYWLRCQGCEAIGIDLWGNPARGGVAADWFEFPFVPGYFGTIIAHLSFSLQFLKHHLDPRGDAERFARQYMKVLRSLKLGGRLVYVPGLPFIEQHLPSSNYRVTRFGIDHLPQHREAAGLYESQLGSDPIYACHVERVAADHG